MRGEGGGGGGGGGVGDERGLRGDNESLLNWYQLLVW